MSTRYTASYLPAAGGGPANTPINPGAGAVTIIGYAPTVTRTANQSLTPNAGSIVVTGYAPTISQPQSITAGAGTITITGYAPTITQGITTNIVPSVGSITITGYAPSLAQTANQAVSPNAGSMVITGYAPVITQQSLSPNLIPAAGQITIIGYAPDIYQSGQEPPARFNGGFEMVSMEPTYKRILRERYEQKQKVEFSRKQRKRAEHIEKLAAKEALSDHSETQIETRLESLLAEWVALAPKLDLMPIKEAPKADAEYAFKARVSKKIRQLDDEHEENAIEMLLLM